jgi:hypothetical protein
MSLAKAASWVQVNAGKGTFAQIREMAPLVLGRSQRLEPYEYYKYALFRDTLSDAERRAYVSDSSGAALNLRLSPRKPRGLHNLLGDKLLSGFVLERAGIPALAPLAVFGRHLRAPSVPALTSPAEITAFLRSDGALPCFGKPVDGLMGFGAASLLGISGDALSLGDGRTLPVDEFTAEIARLYPQGYIFQPLIRQHPEVEALNGPATGMLRVVTLRGPEGPEVLYSVLKLPAKGAMIDVIAPGLSSNGVALIDGSTGRIVRAQNFGRMCLFALETAPATGASLIGTKVPMIAEAEALACQVQALFPGHGLLGLDVALAEGGPIVNEVNWNPGHLLYQGAADRGLLNPDFLPRIEAAAAETRRVAGEAIAQTKPRQRLFGRRR